MPDNQDLVLVGVVNRRKDLEIALNEHWYRIPVKYAPKRKANFLDKLLIRYILLLKVR